ncbi:hypothetical protein [Syntrophothermus lipocalidus]|uniref:Uncharacterized protein n=1 Tax=Syntrophothermus lipocalidus (strain DSM 12680 / TGB-C1) TaxID=643648 RepID=D7CIK9_SYNLT|nr:hypothetical protein [Syntrophothermus lipocalidus]ADI00874.1 conserved hypothetical protein [Syntrophothermus lipocalidus DSM 12680]
MVAANEFLGRLTLRNEYEVFASATNPSQYIVRQRSKSQVFEDRVLKENVRVLHQYLKGKMVTVNGVLDEIDRGAIPGLKLYCYGYKRRFEVQNILIVLCSLGLATVEKQGRGFIYRVAIS